MQSFITPNHIRCGHIYTGTVTHNLCSKEYEGDTHRETKAADLERQLAKEYTLVQLQSCF